MPAGGVLNRRQFIRGLAAFAAAAACPPRPGMAIPLGTLVVNVSEARLRAGAGTEMPVLATLPRGVAAIPVGSGGEASGYRWLRVAIPATGAEGYIVASLLSPRPAGTTPPTMGKSDIPPRRNRLRLSHVLLFG